MGVLHHWISATANRTRSNSANPLTAPAPAALAAAAAAEAAPTASPQAVSINCLPFIFGTTNYNTGRMPVQLQGNAISVSQKVAVDPNQHQKHNAIYTYTTATGRSWSWPLRAQYL